MQHRIETTVGPDGVVILNRLPFDEGEVVEIIVSPRQTPGASEPRPLGLCVGEFVVPDSFDAPLPEKVLQEFEG
jgi:hypothetical protein